MSKIYKVNVRLQNHEADVSWNFREVFWVFSDFPISARP